MQPFNTIRLAESTEPFGLKGGSACLSHSLSFGSRRALKLTLRPDQLVLNPVSQSFGSQRALKLGPSGSPGPPAPDSLSFGSRRALKQYLGVVLPWQQAIHYRSARREH